MVRALKHVNRPSLGCAGAKLIAHAAHTLISSFFDRYKAAAKHMNKESYIFFHLRLADLHNKWLISQAKPKAHKNKVQLETCRHD